MRPEDLARLATDAALGRHPDVCAALTRIDTPASQIAATLRYHHLIGLVLSAIHDSGSADRVGSALVGAIEGQRPVQVLSAGALLAGFDDVRRILSEAGVDVALLKGLYFAERLYGGFHRRTQFDLDVLVRAGDRRRAARHLTHHGFVRRAYDLHSQTFVRDGLKVDLHGWLRRAPAYRLSEQAVWESVESVRVGDLEVLTLDDEFTLVLLGLASFEDLGQGMLRLKQALDMVLLVRQLDASFDWESFFSRRKVEGVEGVITNVLSTVLTALDCKGETPRLTAALDKRRGLLVATSRVSAMDLVFAPRKDPRSFEWFGRVYPGSLPYYLAWFWLGGFPANLAGFQPSRMAQTLRVASSSARRSV